MNRLISLVRNSTDILKSNTFYLYRGEEEIEEELKNLTTSFEKLKDWLDHQSKHIPLTTQEGEIIEKLNQTLLDYKEKCSVGLVDIQESYNTLETIYQECKKIINNYLKNEEYKSKKEHSMYNVKFIMNDEHDINTIKLLNKTIRDDNNVLTELVEWKKYRKQAIGILLFIVKEYENQKERKKEFKVDFWWNKIINFIQSIKWKFWWITCSRSCFPNCLSTLKKLIKNAWLKIDIICEWIEKRTKWEKSEVNDSKVYTIKILD